MSTWDAGDACFPFTLESIDLNVARAAPGVYVLGTLNGANRFEPRFVGRADGDVNEELKAKLPLGYVQFWFSYAASPAIAFQEQCQVFHDHLDRLDDKTHPAKLNGGRCFCPLWQCPTNY